MKLELLPCPKCMHKTLMVKDRANFVQQSGASESWDAWYCTGCGNGWRIDNKKELKPSGGLSIICND